RIEEKEIDRLDGGSDTVGDASDQAEPGAELLQPAFPRSLRRRREVAAARGRGVEAAGSRSRPVGVPSAVGAALHALRIRLPTLRPAHGAVAEPPRRRPDRFVESPMRVGIGKICVEEILLRPYNYAFGVGKWVDISH
ncbi:unnamed protein product, partial [Musa textilis]